MESLFLVSYPFRAVSHQNIFFIYDHIAIRNYLHNTHLHHLYKVIHAKHKVKPAAEAIYAIIPLRLLVRCAPIKQKLLSSSLSPT